MATVTSVKLNNNVQIPILGLVNDFLSRQSKPGDVGQAVKDAIDIGYRHFDCAKVYENQKEIGEAITAKISEGVVSRKDLFITSKLWNTFHRPGIVENALRSTLKEMNLEYIDLYLIHWPAGFKEGDSLFPTGPDGFEYSEYDYVDTWLAMEEIYKKGLAKAIGISNFNKHQIERVLAVATVTPVMNQVECHPYLNQQQLLEFCKSKNIALTAYSPLGRPGSEEATNESNVLQNEKIKSIGKKYNKTAAQVVIRYQIQRGIVVIPKSVHKKRLSENIDTFDFSLSEDDMTSINSINKNLRIITFPEMRSHRFYPFDDEF
ncbi:hypothetical protein FQA39_LY10832 [Lamprigera yunnana]|nr:hypothetical protein FQA39_LY10832 [Lamprigera yunnana]